MNMEKLTLVEVFAGAFGMTEGFVKAGFRPLAHVEMNADACFTIKTRMAYHHLMESGQGEHYEAYLKKEITREELYQKIPSEIIDSVLNYEISDETLHDIFEKIDTRVGSDGVDLIIGGPPCQAYSMLIRHRQETEEDDRNYLYKLYGRFLKKYNPKAFVFENVLGLLNANNGQHFKNIQAYYKRLGYDVDARILNASDYGVFQNRKRVIIVGWKKELGKQFPDLLISRANETVSNLFADLPKLSPGDSQDISSYSGEPHVSIAGQFNFTTQHIARPHNKNDLSIYKRVIQRWNENSQRLKYCDLPTTLKTHANESAFLDRYKVVDGSQFSHTVVAHIAKDGHHYIHPDISQCRSISVREAARLQSFPDDFFFEGSRSSAFKQIGNAVPPLMAYAVAREIKRELVV